ncbi:MAG TPA: TerC family protein [Xanthomonadaceae bacterium]|nr:TerC family protein [Xanthomonadaceae bacterium]
MEWIFDSEIWLALITLATLEIVLGVDNLVFISISVSRLPPERRSLGRRFGLALACVTRILLLLTLVTLARLTEPLFMLVGRAVSMRDLVLIAGGLFLLVKGTLEIRDSIQGRGEEEDISARPSAVFGMVIAQIAVMDIVFSLDSVVTAVGMVNVIPVMVAAIVLAVLVMIFAADPIGEFIDRHRTVKMLALTFIVMVGIALVAEGLGFHVKRQYLYFAMGFSVGVEVLNLVAREQADRRAQLRAHRSERDQ